jgi:FlaG/FlaF family flagellin (archaellin)
VLDATNLKIITSIGNGIEIIPAGGLPAGVVLDHVKVTDTNQALHAEDGAGVTVTNSNLSYNFRGVFAGSNGGPVNVNLSHVTIVGNQNYGIISTSPNTIVRLNDVDLSLNGNGIKATNNAVIYSFQNNRLGADAGNSGTNDTPNPRTQQ